MSGLEIPERAISAGSDAYWNTPPGQQRGGIAERALRAGAPIVVAEAFRRFAEVARCVDDRELATKTAAELDPEGATQ